MLAAAAETATHAASAGIAEKAWLIPLLPALSFLVILFFGKKLPKGGSESGLLAVGASFVLAVLVAFEWISDHTVVDQHWVWWSNGHVDITIGQHVDGLTAMMFLVVTFVSLMVHIYSTGYMHGDVRFTHFFAALSLFTAAMLFMVLADNTLQLHDRLGAGRALLLHADRPLVRGEEQLQRRPQGLLHHEDGRRRPHARRHHAVLRRRRDVPHRDPQPDGPRARDRPRAAPGRRGAAVPRRHGQERPVPAPHLAARRHGRPHARLRPDPRRHHGRGRRLPGGPGLRRLLGGLLDRGRRAELDGADRRHHDDHRRRAGLRAGRHQTGAGLLHRQPAGLHGGRPVGRGVDGRRVPPLHPRLLQGAAVPRARARSSTPCTATT